MGIKPGTLHAEKQFEKQTVQRDFGVKGSIDEKPFILAPEIICSLPGGSDWIEKGDGFISGDAIGVGLRDIGGNHGIEGARDIGDPGSQGIGRTDESIDKSSGPGAV